MRPQPTGYSGTPLSKKLGIVEGYQIVVCSAPADYPNLLQSLPVNVVFEEQISKQTDIVHVFVESRAKLSADLESIRRLIKPAGVVWVSWPKKASKVATDVTEDSIRAVALPLGFVDVKVCAVNEIWSGLKLVIRKALREPMAQAEKTCEPPLHRASKNGALRLLKLGPPAK